MEAGFYNAEEEQEQIAGIGHISDVNWKNGVKKESIECEPTSVLDHRCSPNSPNSASTTTRSSSINGGGIQIQDFEGLTVSVGGGGGGGEGSLLPWFMGHVDDHDPNLSFGFDVGSSVSVHPPNVENFPTFGGNLGGFDLLGFPGSGFDEKPQFGFGEQIEQTGLNPNHYLGSLGYGQSFLPPAKRHNYGSLARPDHDRDRDHEHGFVQVSAGSLLSEQQQQQQHENMHILMPMPMHMPPLNCQAQKSMDQDKDSQLYALRDQLIKVSEMFQTGNFALAQVILARLNHQASLLSGTNTLLGAAALCVKLELEKLMSITAIPGLPPPPKSLGLDDVIHKITAYKLFSEVSPVMQFMDFTCTQVFLEALEDANTIHILDFDIGCGSMWASFIRELPLRKNGAPFLRITVLASTSSYHPIELALICDNILEFATEYGVSVDVKVLNLDFFDSASCSLPGFQLLENEVVAIKFPIWACSHCPFQLPPLLSFMKQCSPKIVMSFDRGGDHSELAFPSHILHGLNSSYRVLESLHGSRVPPETITKIDNHLIRPSVERIIQGRIYSPDKMQANKIPSWKRLFPSSGFVPTTLSNFTEHQALELVSKISAKGFSVEKRGACIALRWLNQELIGGLAWSC